MKPGFTIALCRSLAFWTLLSCWFTASGQIEVDYRVIKQHVQDEGSPLFYPQLRARFSAGDTLMSVDQLRHCYYGFTCEKDYQPYKRTKAIDLVDTMLVKTPDHIDTTRVHRLIDSALASHPFDIEALLYKIRFARATDGNEASIAKWKIRAMAQAIRSSGDGLTKKTPLSVIYVPHEYLMLHFLGLLPTGEQSLGGNELDVIGVRANETRIKSLYFDVSGMRPGSDPLKVILHQGYHVYSGFYPLPLDLVP